MTGDWFDVLPWMMAGRDVAGEAGAPAGGKEAAGGDYVEVQAEYFVPLFRAKEALEAVYAVARHWDGDVPADPGVATYHGTNGWPEGIGPKAFCRCFELRVVRGDRQRLSPCFGRDSLAIHTSLTAFDRPRVDAALADLEAALRPFEVRPHWGKIFTMGREELERLYGAEAFDGFRALCREHDPSGRFVNPWAARLLGLEAAGQPEPGTKAAVARA